MRACVPIDRAARDDYYSLERGFESGYGGLKQARTGLGSGGMQRGRLPYAKAMQAPECPGLGRDASWQLALRLTDFGFVEVTVDHVGQ
jgi:hypothetical protein